MKDRLALLGGTFGSEPSLLVFTEAVKLILGNAPGVFSWVADRVLVAEVRLLETCINAPYLENIEIGTDMTRASKFSILPHFQNFDPFSKF